MSQNSSFELVSATREDIPRLAEIHRASSAEDLCVKILFPNPNDLYAAIQKMLEKQVQIGDPDWTHIKAVDIRTGEIAAWASWLKLSHDSNEEEQQRDCNEIDQPPETAKGEEIPPAKNT